VRGLTKLRRVSGFSFEPSWLAGQLATLYLPWLTASLLTGFKITKTKCLEPILLVFTSVILLLPNSRGGLLIVLLSTFMTVLAAGRQAIRLSLLWFFRAPKRSGWIRFPHLREWSLRIGVFLLLLGIVTGATVFLASQNYFNRLWTVSADSLPEYFVKTNAGGRVSYLWATIKIFGAHPWLGTGLGSSGFYLYQNLPDWALSNIPEITKQLAPSSLAYPNPKNMYLRLLAETGIVGAMLFVSFLLGILAEIKDLFASSAYKFIGVAGLFSWVAIGIYYLMQDSFAMAELWINFGIVLGLTTSLPLKKEQESLTV
ncbi:MAG: O-antigen ligase family protein, partial [Anaerolineales bacterium]|nr:O-antigen ligase family protein [Anaerolineales bacterium]